MTTSKDSEYILYTEVDSTPIEFLQEVNPAFDGELTDTFDLFLEECTRDERAILSRLILECFRKNDSPYEGAELWQLQMVTDSKAEVIVNALRAKGALITEEKFVYSKEGGEPGYRILYTFRGFYKFWDEL